MPGTVFQIKVVYSSILNIEVGREEIVYSVAIHKMNLSRCALFVFSVCLLAANFLAAQSTTATILGVVKDESGAVIPGVEITVKQVETGVVHEAISGDTGTYRVPGLPPGNYQVQTALAGFQG